MQSRRFSLLSVVLGAVLCVIIFRTSTIVLRSFPQTSNPAPPPAFTATRVDTYYRPDGTLADKNDATYASRGDGTSVLQTTHQREGQTVTSKGISDLNADALTSKRVRHDKATVTVGQIHPETARQMRAAWTQCASGQYAGKDIILGFDVVRIIKDFPPGVTESGDTHHFSFDEWQAPALGCYPLKKVNTKYRNGVAGAHSVFEVTSVTMGQPDPSLFEIPPGYTIQQRTKPKRP